MLYRGEEKEGEEKEGESIHVIEVGPQRKGKNTVQVIEKGGRKKSSADWQKEKKGKENQKEKKKSPGLQIRWAEIAGGKGGGTPRRLVTGDLVGERKEEWSLSP